MIDTTIPSAAAGWRSDGRLPSAPTRLPPPVASRAIFPPDCVGDGRLDSRPAFPHPLIGTGVAGRGVRARYGPRYCTPSHSLGLVEGRPVVVDPVLLDPLDHAPGDPELGEHL